MNAHTLDTLYRRAFIRAVISTVSFAVAMIVLLVSTGNAYAAVTNGATPEQWAKANDACAGAQIDTDVNPACATRGRLAKALAAKGYVQGLHGVWYTNVQRYEFANAMLYAGNSVSAGYTDASLRAALTGLYHRLAGTMTDAQMFAIWNDNGTEFIQVSPTGAVLAHRMLEILNSEHAAQHDPRYDIDR